MQTFARSPTSFCRHAVITASLTQRSCPAQQMLNRSLSRCLPHKRHSIHLATPRRLNTPTGRRRAVLVQANRDQLRKAFQAAGPPPDLASRLMFERIIYLGMPIDDNVSELLVAQLLWLGRPVSSLQTNKVDPIYLYVNSTGMAKNPKKPGNEHQAFAVYTMMLAVQKFCPIYTLCVGNAFGEAALLLAAGTPGKRASLRSSTIMIRQPLQRYGGMQASDIDIYRREIRYTTNLMADYLAWHTKKDIETVKQDFARPRYFTPYEAVEYGLIDMVLEPNDPDRLVYKDWDKIGSKIGVLKIDDAADPPAPANIMY